MANADLMIEVFPRASDRVGDGAALASFLAEAARRGYWALSDDEAFALLAQPDAAPPYTPGITETVQNALAAFSAGTSDLFDCYLRYCPPANEDYGLLFRLTISRDGTILLGVNDGTFKYNEFGLKNYERFIEFVTLVYLAWPPLYGYMSEGPSWEQDDVRDLEADALYELTIFGPEYVSKIGREKFDAIHVWRNISMEDGGRIIAVGLYARYTDPTWGEHPTAVAEELGLESPDFMD